MTDLFGGGDWTEVQRPRSWGTQTYRWRKLVGGHNEVEMLAPDGTTWIDVRHPATVAEVSRHAQETP